MYSSNIGEINVSLLKRFNKPTFQELSVLIPFSKLEMKERQSLLQNHVKRFSLFTIYSNKHNKLYNKTTEAFSVESHFPIVWAESAPQQWACKQNQLLVFSVQPHCQQAVIVIFESSQKSCVSRKEISVMTFPTPIRYPFPYIDVINFS